MPRSKISGDAENIEFTSTFVEGNITGNLSGELLGCYTDLGGEITCELGFHKSALSVIQNASTARDYEYQWIYSHHKVVYYSGYLIIELFRECVKLLLKEKTQDVKYSYEDVLMGILSWQTMLSYDGKDVQPYKFAGIDYFRPVDSDIYVLFKTCQNVCRQKGDTTSLVACC